MTDEQETGVWDGAFPLEVPLDFQGARVLGGTIANVPPGALVSAGVLGEDGVWSLESGDLEGLSLSPPASGSGETILTVSLRVQVDDGGGPPETVAFGVALPATPGFHEPEPEPIPEPVPGPVPGPAPEPILETESEPLSPPGEDVPAIPAEAAPFDADRAIALAIDTGFADTATPGLTAIISGVPRGAALSAGHNNGDSTWTLTVEELEDLQVSPPADATGDFIIGIAVTGGEGLISSGSLMVEIGEISHREPVPEPEFIPEPVPASPPLQAPVFVDDLEDATPEARPSPVAYWKLDESTGAATVDQTGMHHGQVFGNHEDEGGAFHAIAVFDGIDDYIRIPPDPAMELARGTLTLWFCAFAIGSGTIASRGGPEAPGYFALRIRDGRLQLVTRSAGGEDFVVDAGTFGANDWNQATVTWTSGGGPSGGTDSVKAYLNGEAIGSGECAGGLDVNTAPWCFGAVETMEGEAGQFFHGEMDDIALYARPLTAAEAHDLCQVGVDGVMSGDSPEEMDSGLDFSAIPVADYGPESLATLDVPGAESEVDAIDNMLGGLVGESSGDVPEADTETEPEPAPIPEPTPEPALAPVEEQDEQAISIGGDGGLTIEGGEKLQW